MNIMYFFHISKIRTDIKFIDYIDVTTNFYNSSPHKALATMLPKHQPFT